MIDRPAILTPDSSRSDPAGTTTRRRVLRVFRVFTALMTTLALGLASCGDQDQDRVDETPMPLRIGVLPDESSEGIRSHYRPLLAYLEATTGIRCVLTVPDSYESLLTSFCRGELDLAYFGGYTYAAARERAGAVPLVTRAEDRRFVSYFLVAGKSPAESIEDLAGSRLAFGSELSTSGHLMPRRLLRTRGLTPERHFREIVYTGSHDATARAVRDGEADLGAANHIIIDAMRRDGRLAAGDVRILDETPPYVNYVWVVRRELPEAMRIAVRDAFLALTPERADHREVLRGLSTEVFLPAAAEEFDDIALVARELGMLEEPD